jgi:hypothetical protein
MPPLKDKVTKYLIASSYLECLECIVCALKQIISILWVLVVPTVFAKELKVAGNAKIAEQISYL